VRIIKNFNITTWRIRGNIWLYQFKLQSKYQRSWSAKQITPTFNSAKNISWEFGDRNSHSMYLLDRADDTHLSDLEHIEFDWIVGPIPIDDFRQRMSWWNFRRYLDSGDEFHTSMDVDFRGEFERDLMIPWVKFRPIIIQWIKEFPSETKRRIYNLRFLLIARKVAAVYLVVQLKLHSIVGGRFRRVT